MVIPYFHIYGFTVGMMKGTWVGALQVLIPKYDVEQVLAAMRDLRPTYFPAVPTVFVSLLAHLKVKEFGLELPDDVEVRVWDSTAEIRYLVLPERPSGTERMSEEELAALVTRDSMVGTGLAKAPAGARPRD